MKYEVFGLNTAEEYIVGYRTPRCDSVTVATTCTTIGQANEAARTLNDEFKRREEDMRADQIARGFRLR